MKKIIIFLIMIILLPSPIKASTNTASSYVLMEQHTNRILDSKNENNPMLIASITKIMTAIIAIESNKLDEIIVVDESILKAYGSGIYIKVGEEISLRDLLYGLMLRSGNDAALMISNYLYDSEEKFVQKMNNKAKQIGMINTTFVNSSGLDNEDVGNYSTAYDMALLTSYAMNNKEYQKIVSTKKHTVKTNYKTYIWHNKNKLLSYNYITGGKTGYTEKAKRTLVSTASKNNLDLVVVTLRDSDDWNTHLELYEYATNNYLSYQVLDKDSFFLKDNSYYKAKLFIKKNLYLPLTKKEITKVSSKIKLYKQRKYQNNDVVGVNEFYLNNKLIASANIYVEKENFQRHTNFFQRIVNFFKS